MRRLPAILLLLLFTLALWSLPEPLPARSSDTIDFPCFTIINRCGTADVEVKPALGERALEIFESYIGQRETRGYNRSPIIDRWNRHAGVPLGSSYCEAAAYSMFDSAATELGIDNPFMRTAGCSRQLRHATMIGSGLEVIPISRVIGGRADIERGDHMIHRRGGGSDAEIGRDFLGHAGIADTLIGQTLATVEANTSPGRRGSQRNGDGVWDRTRPVDWWLAAIRVPR